MTKPEAGIVFDHNCFGQPVLSGGRQLVVAEKVEVHVASNHLAFHDVPGTQLPLVDPPEVLDQVGPPEGAESAVILALEVNRLEVGGVDVVEHCSSPRCGHYS